MTRPRCRATGSSDVHSVLDFGQVPVADVLLREDQLQEPDPVFPLDLAFCTESALLQLTGDVPLDILYNADYPYYTSVNPTLVKHFEDGAAAILKHRQLGAGSLVVEAASNDGCQLAAFQRAGLRVLGVDPSSGPVEKANAAGIPSVCRFFDHELSREVVEEHGKADLITGNNVLNLVQDLPDFLSAVDTLLADDGLLVLEVPYLVDTVRLNAFDNVFHQNVTYWTATSLDRVFARIGLKLLDVERIATFGGSLRAYFVREGHAWPSVDEILHEESQLGADGLQFYLDFADRARAIRDELRTRILSLREGGSRIVAYGAAGGMATTLLAYLDLPEGTFEYAVDLSPHKHGRYTTGSRLLIRPVETLLEDRPDHALLLAWNFEQPIRNAQQTWLDAGGQFIVPIPEVRIG